MTVTIAFRAGCSSNTSSKKECLVFGGAASDCNRALPAYLEGVDECCVIDVALHGLPIHWVAPAKIVLEVQVGGRAFWALIDDCRKQIDACCLP